MSHGDGRQERIRRFWDQRAEEDAFFFVDNRLDYRNPGLEGFWTQGERDLDVLLASLQARIKSTDVVLDLGCGVGRLTRPVAKRAAACLPSTCRPACLMSHASTMLTSTTSNGC